MKALYYGYFLQVLRDSIATESVDLIYLDPQFNSQATYLQCPVLEVVQTCWQHGRGVRCSPRLLNKSRGSELLKQ